MAQGGGCAPLQAELLTCLHWVCPQHLWPALASPSTGSSAKQSPAITHTGEGDPPSIPGRIPVRQTPAGLWELKSSQRGPAMASVLAWGWWQAGILCASQKDASQVCSAQGPQTQGHRAGNWQWAGDSHSSSRQTGRVEGRMGGVKQIIKTKSQ